MLVKVCGITNVEDAAWALDRGADWIGVNLVAGPRRIDLAKAVEIIASLHDPTRTVVLLLIEAGSFPAETISTLRDQGVRRVQVYGDVTPRAARRLSDEGLAVILPKPIAGPRSIDDVEALLSSYAQARPAYVLLDAASKGQLGGTGRPADWETIARAREAERLDEWPPILLAGGLNPQNVAEAIRTVAPTGVDVSSGVESEPGRKDRTKVKTFIDAARAAK